MLNPSSHLHILRVFKKEHINYDPESASEGPLSPRRPLSTFYNGDQQQSHCRRGFCSNLSLSLSDKHRFNQCVGNCTPNNLHQKEVETWTAWNCWPKVSPEQQLSVKTTLQKGWILLNYLFLNHDDYWSTERRERRQLKKFRALQRHSLWKEVGENK